MSYIEEKGRKKIENGQEEEEKAKHILRIQLLTGITGIMLYSKEPLLSIWSLINRALKHSKTLY